MIATIASITFVPPRRRTSSVSRTTVAGGAFNTTGVDPDAMPMIEAMRRYVYYLHQLQKVALRDPEGFMKHLRFYMDRLERWNEEADRKAAEAGADEAPVRSGDQFRSDMRRIALTVRAAEVEKAKADMEEDDDDE